MMLASLRRLLYRPQPPPASSVALLPRAQRKELLSAVLGRRRSKRAHAREVAAICDTSPIDGVLAGVIGLTNGNAE